jgi:hypothetical protein
MEKLDTWIINKIFQPITNLFCKLGINPYSVVKFTFDGAFFISVFLSLRDLYIHYNNSSVVFEKSLMILCSLIIWKFLRVYIEKDENSYRNRKYFISISRTFMFYRLIYLFTLFLPPFNVYFFVNFLFVFTFYLWATMPMPPIKRIHKSVFSEAY